MVFFVTTGSKAVASPARDLALSFEIETWKNLWRGENPRALEFVAAVHAHQAFLCSLADHHECFFCQAFPPSRFL